MEANGLIQIRQEVPVSLIEMQTKILLEAFYSGKSQRTIEAYKRDWQDFQRFLGAETEREATLNLLGGSLGQANSLALQYRQHLIDRGLQPTTINRKLAALRSLSDMAYTLGMV